ncbi:MAG: mechanosensitive ion channel protein MscS [Bacteroidetes bacterium HGW-Bacteroidetes-3]|nr:MAG: mechanosensitive ion channel protein MscS [Bacteroidetes bacterium HGW-Bacteroidetes-3]
MNKFINYFLDLYHNFMDQLPTILIALVVLTVGFLIASGLKNLIQKKIKPRLTNTLSADFISQVSTIIIRFIVIVVALNLLGFKNFTTQILAGAGILTFVLGFAFKDIGENFLAGIILAFKSPFRLKDLIESGSVLGYVQELNLRETRVKTPDGKDVFIPNGQILKNPLINYTLDGFLRYEFIIGLDYNSNLAEGIKIISDSVSEVDDVLSTKNKKTTVLIDELTASTVNFKIQFWINTFKSTSKTYHNSIRSAVIDKVVQNLTKNGFYLPSTIVEIKKYKP